MSPYPTSKFILVKAQEAIKVIESKQVWKKIEGAIPFSMFAGVKKLQS